MSSNGIKYVRRDGDPVDEFDHPKGYEVWGRNGRSKEVKRLHWQPMRGAAIRSYNSLGEEGFSELTIRKVGTDVVYDSPEALQRDH